MAATGQSDPWREIAGIVLGRPDAIRGRFDRRRLDRGEANTLRAGRAADVPVQAGMIQKNLQAAANEQDDEKKVNVMSNAYPKRKALLVRSIEQARRTRGHRWEAEYYPLNVGRNRREQER